MQILPIYEENSPSGLGGDSEHTHRQTHTRTYICIHCSYTLALIVNQSLCTGIFPELLKTAEVLPLYKKDNPHKFDNYRPISLLPVILKDFEKVVYTIV